MSKPRTSCALMPSGPTVKSAPPLGEGVPGGEASQSNVSAIWHGGKLLTSGEVGYPYELSPDDLST